MKHTKYMWKGKQRTLAELAAIAGISVSAISKRLERNDHNVSEALRERVPLTRQDSQRDWWLRRKYGLTLAEYQKMVGKQQHKCKICHEVKSLVVDHHHESGTVRGLLCSKCNTGLGMFDDDRARLRAAADYVTRIIPGKIEDPRKWESEGPNGVTL